MIHKCENCIYKGEHREMGFRPFGVCQRGVNLIEAEKAYNAEKCPYIKEKVTKMSEPDSVDGWLREIWVVGADYDGCCTVVSLKKLIDELVAMSQKARECLCEGKLFSTKTAANKE